ncbi:MAG: response regulator transcription factor [Planctomycetota bacterium]|jgi:DNA-binding response OmpR family regulator
MTKPRILVVEDEPDMRAVLRDNLEYEGYEVLEAADGREGLERAVADGPALVIMDIMMPVLDGLEATKRLRAKGLWMPVIFLSARGEEVDRILGLEIGGDDYVTKPFSMRELMARVKVILRRTGRDEAPGPLPRVGEREIDFDTYAVIHPDGSRQALSHLEVRLLSLLMREKNKPLDRARILDEVWGIEAYPTDRTVDNTVVRLRKKLEPNPKDPRHIITVHGVGYKYVE